MSIVIVGGHDRMHCRYKEICKKHGAKCKIFTQCPSNLKEQMGTPDVVVLFTSTVAHNIVGVALSQAEKAGSFIARSHSSSAHSLNEILDDYFAQKV